MDVDEQAKQLRAALRAAREARGLSQTALGKQLGRSTYQTVHQWETGRNKVTLPNFLEWAGALGFEVKLVPADDRVDVVCANGTHRYWSTHCRHGNHEACAAVELAPGVPRRPAQCRTCAAPCICPCHGDTEARDG